MSVTVTSNFDTITAPANVSFPFSSFPSEIRKMVYVHLLLTPGANKTITPDLMRSHRDEYALSEWLYVVGSDDGPPRQDPNDASVHRVNMGSGLPFLQKCQQMHKEATAMLYGNHVFRFDDTQYG